MSNVSSQWTFRVSYIPDHRPRWTAARPGRQEQALATC